MYNSQYYTCEQIDQRLLQGYLDDYNSQNNTSLTKAQFLTKLYDALENYEDESEVIDLIEDYLGSGFLYAGLATPTGTPILPQDHQAQLFFIAISPGTYTNYGNITIANTGLHFILWDTATWSYNTVLEIDQQTGQSTTKVMSQKAVTDILTSLTNITSNLSTNIGYYECSTGASTAAKTVTAEGYILTVGGAIKIKMINENTAENATLNINSTGAKPLYYANDRVSSNNSWPEGSTVEVYYDGDNYYANNVISASNNSVHVNDAQELSDEQKAQALANVGISGIDSEPVSGSENLVKSGGVFNELYNKENEPVVLSYLLGATTKTTNNTILGGLASTWKVGYIYIAEDTSLDEIKFISKDKINYSLIQVIGISGVVPADGTSYTKIDHTPFTNSGVTVEKTIPITDTLKGKYLIISTHRDCELQVIGYKNIPVKEIANSSRELSMENSQKLGTVIAKVAGLNDQNYYSGYYPQYGIGEYTRPYDTAYSFNSLLIRGVDLADNTECEYRVYTIPAGQTAADRGYAPHNKSISELSGTLIKQGTIIKQGTGFNDYEVLLDSFITCTPGMQVLFLLSGVRPIRIKGTMSGEAPSGVDTNHQLYSLLQGAEIWNGKWYGGNDDYLAQSLWLYSKPTFVPVYLAEEIVSPIIEAEVEGELNSRSGNWLQIQIPDIVYAVVGTELNLWNDAIALSSDRGLASPLNYQVRWNCNKGLITDRCFRYTPDGADAGSNISCSCFIYDNDGVLASSKTFTIKVLAKNALQAAKNIAYFGDSLGLGAASALYDDFNSSDKFTGVAPNMVGTNGTTFHYDAVGGYKWEDYATIGRPGYRAYVSGVTSISVGAVYSDGVANFEVIEVNITDGSGNILLRSHYTHHGVLIMPSGTLTKVSGGGDNSVPYSGAFEESSNPLWNDTTEQLDITQYKSMVGLQSTDKIDAVSFQFGINDHALANDTETLMTYIDAVYHCFVDDNPNCKFIIGLTTSAGNDFNGSGANYGATWNWYDYLNDVYKLRQFYLTLQNNQEYPNIRIAPIGLEIDRYYGYAFSERPISQRSAETEKYHNNYVHPGGSGYGQIGDAYFAAYIGALTEE